MTITPRQVARFDFDVGTSSPVDPPPDLPVWAMVIITLAAAVLVGETLWLFIQGVQ